VSVCHGIAWTLREAPDSTKRRAFLLALPKCLFPSLSLPNAFLRAFCARFPTSGPWIGAYARPLLPSIPGSCGEFSCCLRFLLLPPLLPSSSNCSVCYEVGFSSCRCRTANLPLTTVTRTASSPAPSGHRTQQRPSPSAATLVSPT
jgi:hypothetical protein